MQFSMLDGTALVTVLVSHSALQATEQTPLTSSDYLTRFQKHRPAFEHIASDKHARGLVEENGSIVIRAGDR